MKRVVFLSAQSMNDALGAAGRAHQRLFEELGHRFIEIDFSKPTAQDLLGRTLAEGGIEFAYSVVGFGADFRATRSDGVEVNLWEASRTPYISLTGDSPAYFFQRHVMPSPWHACLYFFPEHLELRKRLAPSNAMYGIVPPIPFDHAEKRAIDFRRKESGRLLFLKNGNDPNKLVEAWRSGMPTATFLLIADLAGELAGALNGPLADDLDALVRERFLAKGWDVEGLINLRLFFVAQLDDYLRRVKSQFVADTIADFPVIIQGFNWEHMDFSGRKATYVKGGDYTHSRQQIIESLGTVDMSPNTQRAPHDRVLRSFGLHTLCITNRQSFIDQNVPEAATFSYEFVKEALVEKVAEAIQNPRRAVEAGMAASATFRKDRHPLQFAEFMVETAHHLRIAGGERPGGLPDFFVWPPTP